LSAAPALRLELRASRLMAAALFSLHLAAAASLAAVLPAAAGAGVAALVVLLGATTVWNQALLRGKRSVRSLELGEGASAVVQLGDGRHFTATVHARRNVSRWWVTLPLQGGSRRIVVVARDMLPEDEFRRLRLWALWGRVSRKVALPEAARGA
jgi:hypothetical protein